MYKAYRIYLSGSKDGVELYLKYDVIKIAAYYLGLKKIDGFTILDSVGYWEGVKEISYILEVATDKDTSTVKDAINSVRLALEQNSIMVQYPDLSIGFIDKKFIREV